MWAISVLLLIVIGNKAEARYINLFNKGHSLKAEDEEFSRLEKRQRITGALEINGQRFESLGCWRDAWARGLPTLEGEHYLLMEPNYKGRRHALLKCARAASDKKFKVFGIENGGQCFASTDGEKKYQKYGVSKDCKGDGKGGPWSLQVYRFLDSSAKTINGNYSKWSEWTKCSKTCGGGIRRRMRKCSNPAPSNGGQDCRNLGSSIESQECSVKPCSAKFALGTPEFHGIGPSTRPDTRPSTSRKRGGQVPQRADAENNIQQQNPEMEKGAENSPEYHTDHSYAEPANGQKTQLSLNEHDHPSQKEEQHFPMSKEYIKLFGQAALFQNSKTASNHLRPGLDDVGMNVKDKGQFSGNANENNLPESKMSAQSLSLPANPLPLIKEHNESSKETPRIPSDEPTHMGAVEGTFSSSSHATDLHGIPPNSMKPGSLEQSHANSLPVKGNSMSHMQGYNENESNNFGKAVERPQGTNDKVGVGAMTSTSIAEGPHSGTNGITGKDGSQNEEKITKVGESLKLIKTGSTEFQEERTEGGQTQEQNLSKQKYPVNDLQYNQGKESKPSEQPTLIENHHFQSMDTPQKNTGGKENEKLPSTSSQTAPNAHYGAEKVFVGESESSPSPLHSFQNSSQENIPSDSAPNVQKQENWKPVANSEGHESNNEHSLEADAGKEVRPQATESATAPLYGKGVSLKYDPKPSKQVNLSVQQQYSNQEKQQPTQRPGKIQSISYQSQSEGINHGSPILNTQHDQNQPSAKVGTPLVNAGKMTDSQSSQEAHYQPMNEYSDKAASEQKDSKQESKLKHENGKEKGSSLPPSTVDDKGESSGQGVQDKTSNEGEPEPVPILDVFNGGTPSEADAESVNGGGFSGPGEDTGAQSQPAPSSQDSGMEPKPEYDNEAIQGISDMSQREDQNILQQINSASSAGSDEGMGNPSMSQYDDMPGFSQAYTGENSSGGFKEQKLEPGKGEMNQDQERLNHMEPNPNPSLGTEEQPDSDDVETLTSPQSEPHHSAAAHSYNTEPAEECLCPKKECSAKADVAFLVDGSSSIPQPYYARVLEFVKILSRGFDKYNTHVGVMAFGSDVKIAMTLKELKDFRQFDDAVNTAPYIGGHAQTGHALLQLKTTLFALSGRQDAPRAVILLASGGSFDDVVAPAEELRDSGVKVTSIGLGKQANVRELINVASEPKSEHVFTAFLDTLPNSMDDIIQGVCRDVMGIVRDRQEPCTCESYNGQVQPTYSADFQNSSSIPPSDTGPTPEHNYKLHQDEHWEGKKQPYPHGNHEIYQFSVGSLQEGPNEHLAHTGQHGTQSEENGRLSDHGFQSKEDFHPVMVGSSEKQSFGGLHNGGKEVMQHEESHNSETTAKEQHKPIQDGHIIGQQFVPSEGNVPSEATGLEHNGKEQHVPEEKQKWANVGQSEQENSYNGPQQHIQRPEEHGFTAGVPEHLHYLANKERYQKNTAEGKPTGEATYGEKINEGPSQENQQFKEEGPQGNDLPLGHPFNARMQGSGGHENPSFIPPPAKDIAGEPMREHHASYDSSRGRNEYSPHLKEPTKVMAVGNAMENYNGAQQHKRHECAGVNLGVVLDSSTSSEGLGKVQSRKMMDLAKEISHLFPVSSAEGNRVGMIVYGGSPQPSVVHFDKFLDQKSMDQAIDNASTPSLEIRIGKALSLAQKHLFSRMPSSKRNVLLLVTDGSSSDDVKRPAIELKRRGVEVFCLGVGKNVVKEQLGLIASDPPESHVFLAPFNDPNKLLETVQKGICESPNRLVRQQTNRTCPSDLGFLIDGSRSVEVLGKGNFKKVLQFVKNVSLSFHISPDETRVAAIVYGTEPKLVLPFNKYTTPKTLAFAIENITYPGTTTMTGKALELAKQKLFDKGSRVNVPKVLVVLTEGTSRDNVTASSEALKKAGVTVITVGLGTVYNGNELDHVASTPAADHVIKAKFNQLRDKVNELQDKICNAKKKHAAIK